MRPEKAAEVREWLEKADRDLRIASLLLDREPPYIGEALFHCQQAVEKTLKGFLTANDRVFQKTHDLDELTRACVAIAPALGPALEPAKDLTVYVWLFRYPGGSEEPPLSEAREGLARSREACESVLALLPSDLRP